MHRLESEQQGRGEGLFLGGKGRVRSHSKLEQFKADELAMSPALSACDLAFRL